MTKPLVIAHRGWSGKFPENTMDSIRGAVELGADMVEIDLQETRDGEVLVFHDYRLNRICRVRARVKAKTASEIQKLGKGVPTFDEVLQYCRGRTRLLVEIKGADGTKVTRMIERFGMTDDVIVFSIKPQRMVELAATNDRIARFGLIARDLTRRVKELESLITYAGLGLSRKLVRSKSMVEQMQRAGRKLFVWTVDQEEEMRRLIDWGVDGLITNVPDVAMRVRGGK